MTKIVLDIGDLNLKELKKISNRLVNQDNRGTRLPIWFLLQDIEERFNVNGEGELLLYQDEDGNTWRGESYEDISKQIIKSEELDLRTKEGKERKEEIEEEVQYSNRLHSIDYEYATKQIFFTEKAAKEHLKVNHYHYSDKARIYVDHAWRNPEAEKIHKVLAALANAKQIK